MSSRDGAFGSVFSVLGQKGSGFFRGVEFAALGLGVAFIGMLNEGLAVALEPFFLLWGGQEVEGGVDHCAGVGEVAEIDFALNAGFEGGIEGQANGGIL